MGIGHDPGRLGRGHVGAAGCEGRTGRGRAVVVGDRVVDDAAFHDVLERDGAAGVADQIIAKRIEAGVALGFQVALSVASNDAVLDVYGVGPLVIDAAAAIVGDGRVVNGAVN